MKFVLYTNSLSAHQLPLAREIVARVGADDFRYIYSGDDLQGGNQEVRVSESWIAREKVGGESRSTAEWLENCDVLLVGGLRPIDLLERRSAKGLRTYYQSERWFKPVGVGLCERCRCSVPGCVRLVHPGYRKMAQRFVRLMNDDPNFITLPIGPWAKNDFLRMGVRADKMIDWGYFVEPSKFSHGERVGHGDGLKVLWVGRDLWWKRVGTIRKAVVQVPGATLDVFTNIPIAQVREEMRKHDVYVLASNALEGWGAALSEAMEEGMNVLGTYEAGASAALLPESHLFHAGDWWRLAVLLKNLPPKVELPKEYTAAGAAEKLLEMIENG